MITATYAAVLAILFGALSIRTLRLRRRFGVAIGPGERILHRAVRAHAHFAEYCPLILLLCYFVEVRFASPIWMHGLLAPLAVGRVVHAMGISREPEDFRYRVAGMSITLTILFIAAGLLLLGPWLVP